MTEFSLNYSQLESSVFKYEFYRTLIDVSEVDSAGFAKKVIDKNADVIRAKLIGNDKKALLFLNALNIPFELYNINYLNEMPIASFSAINIDKNVVFREVKDPSEDESFKRILNSVLESESWVEYSNPISDVLMSPAKRKELAFKYYSTEFYKISNQPLYMVLNLNGHDVGIATGEFKNQGYYGALFGLLPEYRSKGLAKYFYQLMIKKCNEIGVEYFKNEVNIFNIKSQSSANNRNLKASNFYLNVAIYPFYNINERFIEIDLNLNDLSGLIVYLKDKYPEYGVGKIINNSGKFSQVEMTRANLMCQELENDELLIVLHSSFKNAILSSVYVYLKKYNV